MQTQNVNINIIYGLALLKREYSGLTTVNSTVMQVFKINMIHQCLVTYQVILLLL